MSKYSEVAKQITQTFDNNLFSLKEKYQYHWAVRKYRVVMDDRFIQPIFADYQKRLLRYIPKIRKLGPFWTVRRIAFKMLESYEPDTPKKKIRFEVYKKNPEIFFYFNLMHFLFLTKTYELDKLEGISKFYDKAVNQVKRSNFVKTLFSQEVVETNPSQVANNAYYLSFLGVGDYEERLLDLYKDFWLSKEPKDTLEWKSKIYALTHLIIASTRFYQRFAQRDKFLWVLQVFESKIDEIIEKTNVDVVAEVGLCFKLCEDEKNLAIEKAKEFVVSKFDKKCGFIPRDDYPDNLEKTEHRNAVATLLLQDYEKLNPGPNLLDYMKDVKRGFFLPKGGKYIGVEEDVPPIT